jgi:hypothetical protein
MPCPSPAACRNTHQCTLIHWHVEQCAPANAPVRASAARSAAHSRLQYNTVSFVARRGAHPHFPRPLAAGPQRGAARLGRGRSARPAAPMGPHPGQQHLEPVTPHMHTLSVHTGTLVVLHGTTSQGLCATFIFIQSPSVSHFPLCGPCTLPPRLQPSGAQPGPAPATRTPTTAPSCIAPASSMASIVLT